MPVRVEQTTLPGIGVRHDLFTSHGRQIGVVKHRTGEREMVLYDRDDPDAVSDTVKLSEPEAEALSELLGASMVLGQLAGLREIAGGLITEQVLLPSDSPYVGRRLGDARVRRRTGASIVAVLRDGEVLPSPEPAFRFQPADSVVVVGTRSAIDAVNRVFSEG